MDVRPLHTEDDLTWALNEIAIYFEQQPVPGSPEADRFEVLTTLIDTYESQHWPIPEADPIAVLEYAMSDMGRSQAELAGLLGSRSRASEVLSRYRPLTLGMIRRISESWNLPIDALAAPYKLAKPKQPSKVKAVAKRKRKTKAA